MAKKVTKVVSPPGIAVYPRLNQPDTKYDANGTFHTKLRMDTDEPIVAKFIEQIDTWHAESMEEFKQKLLDEGKVKTEAAAEKKVKSGDKPYSYVEDDEGNETNEVEVNFKMRHRVPDRKNEGKFFTFTPVILDAGTNILKGDDVPLIYGGSLLRIRFEPIKWGTLQLGASVQLRMDAAQILELVTGSAENADGFDAVDGGYEVTNTPVEAGPVTNVDDDGDEDDGDF